MNNICEMFQSTLGRKLVVAISGLMLFGFVIGHLLGNLLIFQGQDALNEYAYFLKSKPAVLWGARIGLIVALLAHLWGTLTLKARSDSARPVPYFTKEAIKSTFMSRTMLHTGILILVFVFYHLAHFTFGWVDPASFSETAPLPGHAVEQHNVYGMIIAGFSNPLIVLIYVAAMVTLAIHLSHGIASIVQTLGFNHPTYTPLLQKAAVAIAAGICLVNSLISISVLSGAIKGGN